MAAGVEIRNNMSALITLATDLGLTDAYVAAMKGVILSIDPERRLSY